MNIPKLTLNNGKTMEELVKLIRLQAKRDECFANVCHIFANRDRARAEVTLQTLALTMKRERFTYTKDQLSTALRFLATCGVGRLELDAKKRVVALREIQVTLQSLGQMALADDKQVPEPQVFKSDTFPKYVPMTEIVHSDSPQVSQSTMINSTNHATLVFNGTVLNVKLSGDADIGNILTTLLKHGVLS
jgi:hypothetical protein